MEENNATGRGQAMAGAGIGHTVEVLEEAPSTNTLLANDAGKLGSHGYVLRARHQTAGRGQRGRQWASVPGMQLQVSVVAHLRAHVERLTLVSLLTGVAVAEAIAACVDVPVSLKWPNDVQVNGGDGMRKVCGILVENHPAGRQPRLVIGVGLNCNGGRGLFPPELQQVLTTLAEEAGSEPDQDALLAALLERLEAWWQVIETDPAGDARIREAWLHLGRIIGRRVRLNGEHMREEGTVGGMTEEGYLIIRLDDGKMHTQLSSDLEWLD